MYYFWIAIVILYMVSDLNYFFRSCFTVLSSRIYQEQFFLTSVTTIYGVCSFQDCDIRFKRLRLARLVREIDFSRYHFYDRTGIYRRSQLLNIRSLQGCTLTLTLDPVPLFKFYKINTKLIYWDDCSLFFEHEVLTIFDQKVRCLLVSRQHAIGGSTENLLEGLNGSEKKPICPEYIKCWLKSMQITSARLRADS